MVRVTRLVLGLSVLASTSFAAAPARRSRLTKRDIADDVCGSASSPRTASDNRNADTWNLYNMGDWFKNMTKPWVVMNWNLNGIQANDIQTVVLTEAGNEGAEKCDEILDPNCSGTGLDINLCRQHPEAHFVWFAITHWAHFMNKLHGTFDDSTISLSSLTSTLVKQFFTPQSDPSQLIMPVGILSGIAAALSAAWPPAAVAAGAGSIVNGILTQAGLNKPDPLVQWGQVQSAIGSAFTQIQKALESYFDYTLHKLPGDPNGGITYDADPTELPMIFASGAFAGTPEVGVFNPGIYGALAASAINALWIQDKVVIIKINDAAYGKGDGAACKAFPSRTACLDGVAYIFVKWAMDGGSEITFSEFFEHDWNVWGAYAEGSGNDDHLKDYALTLGDIAASAQKTQDQNGFLFKNQNGATIDQLKSNPTDLKLADLMYWSLPICDIPAIIGPDKHLNGPGDETGDDPIVHWGPCTCVQAQGWPTGDGEYPDDKNGVPPDECRSSGWGNN